MNTPVPRPATGDASWTAAEREAKQAQELDLAPASARAEHTQRPQDSEVLTKFPDGALGGRKVAPSVGGVDSDQAASSVGGPTVEMSDTECHDSEACFAKQSVWANSVRISAGGEPVQHASE